MYHRKIQSKEWAGIMALEVEGQMNGMVSRLFSWANKQECFKTEKRSNIMLTNQILPG